MKKIYFGGYLNLNLGDDLFLYILSKRYPNIRIYGVSLAPYINTYKNVQIDCFNMYDRFLNKFNKKQMMKKVKKIVLDNKLDYMLFMGGSIFMEESAPDYRTVHNTYGLPFFVIGANFGPYSTERYLEDYKIEFFPEAEDVCLRDKHSHMLFESLSNVRYAPDIVFSLSKYYDSNLTRYNLKERKKVIISVIDLISRSELCEYNDQYEELIIKAIEYFELFEYEVFLMSFCEKEGDEKAIGRILNKCKNKEVSVYNYKGDIESSLSFFSSAACIVGSRFHSIILALILKKPILPIIYSNKTAELLNDINFKGNIIDIKNIKDEFQFDFQYTCNIDEFIKMSEEHFFVLDQYLE